nr:unnamed protein product [Callosobruchus chinensis]
MATDPIRFSTRYKGRTKFRPPFEGSKSIYRKV